jgi:protein TonB
MESKFGRAMSLSLGTHVAGALVLAFFLTGRGTLPVSSPIPIPLDSHLVWLPAAELPVTTLHGGGMSGGNRQPAPPQAAQVRGPGEIAVPRSRDVRIVPDADPKEQPESAAVIVPFRPATAGVEDIAGALRPVRVGDLSSRGPGSGPGAGFDDGARPGATRGPGVGDGPPGYGGGIEWPVPVLQIKPQYTSEAMRAKLQGMVTLEVVVNTDGTVGDAKVVRSLDPIFGLDQAAIAAVKAWKFKPGMRAGKPIPVLVTVELSFTLR